MFKSKFSYLALVFTISLFLSLVFADTPTISSFLINSTSAGYTNDANVLLGITISGDVNAMRFSCNNSTWSTYETYYSTKYFDINSGSYGCTPESGNRTIYVQVRDTNLDASSVVNNTINLDIVAPVFGAFSPASDVTNGNGANGQAISIALTDDYNLSYISIKLVRGTTTVYDYNSNKCTITGTTASCSFTDLSIDRGGSYIYYLSVYDRAGNYSTDTNSFSFTDSTAPTAPTKPYGYDVNTTVYLQWTALTTNDLNKYGVYKSTLTGFDANSTTFLAYADTNYYTVSGLDENTTYYFRITAFDYTGNESIASDENSYTTDYNYSTDPTITRTDISCDSNYWCYDNEAVFSFAVTNAQYSWLWTTSTTTTPSSCTYGSDCNTSSTATISSITNGTSYFKVKACKPTGCGNTSTFILKIDNNSPTAPGSVAVSNSGYSAILTWTASTDSGGSGLYRYYIYRSDKSSFYANAGTHHAYVDNNILTYTDSAVTKGKTYYYKIKAMDYATNYSSETYSGTVGITIPSGGEDTNIIISTKDTTGKDVSYYNSAKDLNVTILFSKVVNDANILVKRSDHNNEYILTNSDNLTRHSFTLTTSSTITDINIFVVAFSATGWITLQKIIYLDLENPKISFVNLVDGNEIRGKKDIIIDANDNKIVESVEIFLDNKKIGDATKDTNTNYWKFSFDTTKYSSGILLAKAIDGAQNSVNIDVNIISIIESTINSEEIKTMINEAFSKKAEIEAKVAENPNYLSAEMLAKKQQADALLIEAEQLFSTNPLAAKEKAQQAQELYLSIINSKPLENIDLSLILMILSAILIIVGAISAAIFVKKKKGPKGKKIPPYFDEELLIKKA